MDQQYYVVSFCPVMAYRCREMCRRLVGHSEETSNQVLLFPIERGYIKSLTTQIVDHNVVAIFLAWLKGT